GRQHLYADQCQIGVHSGWPGALAERLPAPVRALYPLPAATGPAVGLLGICISAAVAELTFITA
ncbi:MAG: hypothetical protein LBI49_20925, partial [Nocardiopsaceae bacterium]|nr:hypothetical protein [Nocardiopsaceae bacterium]